jgi:hypothetical protein
VKRAIIFALVAFVVSLGGVSGYLVKTHKPPVVAVDSLAAKGDSTHADSARADSTHPDSAAPAKGVVAAADSAVTKADSTAATPVDAVTPAAVAAVVKPVAAVVDPVAKAGAYKQVARVLSAMKPVEAAKVIGFLSDDEVEGLLRAVGPRQAADFLTNIPKERAAVLSRRLLVPKPVGATR